MASSEVYARRLAAFGGETDNAAVNAAVFELLSALPAFGRITGETTVLLKPNLLTRAVPERSVTTHPAVLRAVILAVQKQGAKNVTVADSPGGPYTPAAIKGVYETSGLAAVCRETGTALYTACESGARAANGRLVHSFTLIDPARNSDVIINLPKLKTHALTGISGAVKNLFGCVPGMQKAEFHMRFPARENFGQMLVDLCECVKADIHLMDGLIAMEGDGPAGGTPRTESLLLASEDPYAMDLAVCRYIGMPPARVPYLAAAMENGLCPATLDETLLVGDEAARALLLNFRHPKSYEGPVGAEHWLPGPLKKLGPVLEHAIAPRPVVRRAACIGCGKCAEICPEKVIDMEQANGGKKARIRPKNCIRCFCCHEMCPAKAIAIRRNSLLKF